MASLLINWPTLNEIATVSNDTGNWALNWKALPFS